MAFEAVKKFFGLGGETPPGKDASRDTGKPETREGAPRLRVVSVKADTVGEAMKKAGSTPAGQVELDWVLKNPKEAAKMLKGFSWYYFPEAADGDVVPCVGRYGGRFGRGRDRRDIRWRSVDCVVLRD